MYILIMSSDARIKSKFWGKSMEVFPVGTVNVTIPKLAPNNIVQCVSVSMHHLHLYELCAYNVMLSTNVYKGCEAK